MRGFLRLCAIAWFAVLIVQPAVSEDQFAAYAPDPSLASLVQRRPVPEAAAVAKAEASVKQKFQDDLAGATTAETKLALVTKLLNQTATNTDDAAERYAMLCEARRLAVDAGNVMLMRQTVAALADRFEVDARDELIGALAKMAEMPTLSAPVFKEIAETASGEADAAMVQHEWDKAKRLSDISLTAVRKSKDAALTKQMVEHAKTVTTNRQLWEVAEKALAALKNDPNDAAAHLIVGRYFCFVQQDWNEGLKHLAASNDPALKMLAIKSLAASEDATAQELLGQAWWDALSKAKTKDKPDLRAGAIHWYTLALEGLTGAANERVNRRLDELEGVVAPGK